MTTMTRKRITPAQRKKLVRKESLRRLKQTAVGLAILVRDALNS